MIRHVTRWAAATAARRAAKRGTRRGTGRGTRRGICALLIGLLASALASGTGAADDGRDYRRLIADALAVQMKTAPENAFQAGLLRIAQAPQPGDYAVCLQTVAQGQTAYFAAFIAAGKVETIRRAVGVDRCWLETNYAALPRSTVKRKAAAAPQPVKKQRRPLSLR